MNNQPTPEASTTAGTLFSDGSAIEQISGQRLLRWHRGQAHVGPSFTLFDRTYSPEPLDSALEAALGLSDGTLEFQPPEQLLTELSECFRKRANLDLSSSRIAASFVAATWLPEVLPASPLLNLYGPRGAETALLFMLHALVRRPLQLAECSLAELGRLPDSLHPTLLLVNPKAQVLDKLLNASLTSAVRMLHRGRLLPVAYPAVVNTKSPIGAPALSLALPRYGSGQPRITPADQQALRKFASRLLAYRLKEHRAASTAQISVPHLTLATAAAAHTLMPAVAASTQFQQQLAADLEALDEVAKTEKSEEPAAIVLEALLKQVHDGLPFAPVRDTTEWVNAIYLGRDERVELSAKKVGAILREELGLSARRKNLGYELQLDRGTCARIHELARDWAVLSLQNPRPDCPLCEDSLPNAPVALPPSVPSLPPPSDVSEPDEADASAAEVHNVHNVHVARDQATQTASSLAAEQPDEAEEPTEEVHDVHEPYLVGTDSCAPPSSADLEDQVPFPPAQVDASENAESNVHKVHNVHDAPNEEALNRSRRHVPADDLIAALSDIDSGRRFGVTHLSADQALSGLRIAEQEPEETDELVQDVDFDTIPEDPRLGQDQPGESVL